MRETSIVFIAITAYLIWRGVRGWRRPYVQLTDDTLVVFERGRPKHYIDLTAVATVRERFNQTILEMRDGMKISVSHLGFMFSDDVRDFREILAKHFASSAS